VNAMGTAVSSAAELNGPVPYTLADAAAWLRPPMTAEQLTGIVRWLPGLKPCGTQPTGGRPVNVYDLADLQELHADLRRWL
jgi:hypothetical protein